MVTIRKGWIVIGMIMFALAELGKDGSEVEMFSDILEKTMTTVDGLGMKESPLMDGKLLHAAVL